MAKKPFATTYIDKQTARADAVLPAAGAWDAAPTELFIGGASKVTLTFFYTRGGAAGAFDFELEVADTNAAARWYNSALYEPGVLAAGVDTASGIQREYITYTATGAGDELFVYGPVSLGGAIEWLRVPCRESGNAGAPGDLRVDISLDWD